MIDMLFQWPNLLDIPMGSAQLFRVCLSLANIPTLQRRETEAGEIKDLPRVSEITFAKKVVVADIPALCRYPGNFPRRLGSTTTHSLEEAGSEGTHTLASFPDTSGWVGLQTGPGKEVYNTMPEAADTGFPRLLSMGPEGTSGQMPAPSFSVHLLQL